MQRETVRTLARIAKRYKQIEVFRVGWVLAPHGPILVRAETNGYAIRCYVRSDGSVLWMPRTGSPGFPDTPPAAKEEAWRGAPGLRFVAPRRRSTLA